MEIVENQIFYHISKDEINIGTKLFIGKEKNKFNSFFDKTSLNYRDNISRKEINSSYLIEEIRSYSKTNSKNPSLEKIYSYDFGYTMEYLCSTIGEYLLYVRESLFEEVRRDFFPNYPSRYRCIWVIPDNNEAIKYWWNTLGEQGNIYKVLVSGKIHKANQQYLNLSSESFDFIRGEAFKYWSGITGLNTIEDECLFEGFIEFKDRLSPSQLFF